jgi:ubiquinone/menaquinone biosynthesis C-methylase UbiE
MSTVSYRNYSGSAAENYQRHFVPSIAEPASAALLEAIGLRPGERVLDVACGTGVVARHAAELVGPTGTVTGVDIAPDMIDVARATPAPATPPIDWHVGDATALPFPDDSYDVALCQMGLMFVEDRSAAVAEIHRVLAAGGRVAVSTPGEIQPPFVVLEEAIVEHINPDLGGFVRAVFSMHDPDGVARLLRDAGFEDVSAAVARARLRLPAPKDFLWQYINLTPMAPLVARAPEHAQQAMERQAVEAWQPYVVDGVIDAEQPLVVATARKR